jgi:NADPH-dependent 2,4-dienoyl-CoA reductase/sulfur reductase-like enzyme
VDAIHVSVGVYSTPGNLSIAAMDTEPGFNLFRARAVKEVVNVPIIGVGRINDPRMADEAIGRGDADLISFGRQHLTDPDFINKAQAGNFEDIRWCLACNQGCINRLMDDFKLVTCTINPECGREFEVKPIKAETPKRVWVIGAGPAGLSAALAAARRGHWVEVFEQKTDAGGQLRPASRPPHKNSYMDWVNWAVRQLEKLDVNLALNREVTKEMIRSEKPDSVILAAGAIPVTPDIQGLDGDNVVEAQALLMGRIDLRGPAVILGGGLVGMETADFLISRGMEVTVIELLEKSPVGREDAHGWWLHRRLRKSGGRLILGARVTRVEPGSVVFEQGGEEQRMEPVSLVVVALGSAPVTILTGILEELGLEYHVVGDARKPRDMLEAIHEGHQAGLSI